MYFDFLCCCVVRTKLPKPYSFSSLRDALLSWVLLAALWWAFELNLLSVDYPKSIFNHFFEMFVTSPDATWALLSHTSGLVVFLIIVNIPSKRRWLIFVLLCGVCFLWALKSLGVPETAWASTTNAAGYTLMFFAALTCLGLSFIGGSLVATRHVLALLVRSVIRGDDLQMINDVMQNPLLSVVISRHMRDLSKDFSSSAGSSCSSKLGESANADFQISNERFSQVSSAALLPEHLQQQQKLLCSTVPCPSCRPLVQQLRCQIGELQEAVSSATSSTYSQQWGSPKQPFASSSHSPPPNSSFMAIRCIDGRTVQVTPGRPTHLSVSSSPDTALPPQVHLQDCLAPKAASLHAACQTEVCSMSGC
jgi:hypothetical protein